jgi:glutaredoxin
MKPVSLVEVTSPNCPPCEGFERFWDTIKAEWPNVSFQKIDVTTTEGADLAQKHMILSAPGILVNGELLSSGGFDPKKLIAKLRELSMKS